MGDIFIELSSDIDGGLPRFIMGEESLTLNYSIISEIFPRTLANHVI